MIRVLVADESQRITDNISRRLQMENELVVCGVARDGEYAVQEALRLQPDVALIDSALPGMDGVQTTEMLAQYLPNTGVIMMSMEAENDAYRHAMLAGAREFLQKPFKGDDLVAAIRRVHEFEQRKAVNMPTRVSAAPAAAGNGAALAVSAPSGGSGEVVTIFSGKGGVGKSIVATNVAVLLARVHPGKVVLIDLSLQFGDIGALLNLANERTIAELAANDAVADREVVHQVLLDGPEGLKVLLAPISPELADYVTTAHLRALVDQLRNEYEYILIDCSSYLNEITLDAVEMADRVVLVSDMSVTAVKNARLALSVLEVLHVDPERVILVGNHREGTAELDRGYAESFLRIPINVELPYDPGLVPRSISKGEPFVVTSPQAAVSTAIAQLATQIAPAAAGAGAAAAGGPSSAGDAGRKRQRRILGFARG